MQRRRNVVLPTTIYCTRIEVPAVAIAVAVCYAKKFTEQMGTQFCEQEVRRGDGEAIPGTEHDLANGSTICSRCYSCRKNPEWWD